MTRWLWLSYLALASGLMTFGGALSWLGFRRPPRPAEMSLRVVVALGGLVAVAGAVAAAILEARAVQPW
ncbi:MAG: hypothetical protein ACRELA_07210 [Candidatus Rokuibacteriota bacterium]